MGSYKALYEKYDNTLHRNSTLCGVSEKKAISEMSAIKQFMMPKQLSNKKQENIKSNGFARMDKCRMGLDALDKAGVVPTFLHFYVLRYYSFLTISTT
jgi:hypothetical protein